MGTWSLLGLTIYVGKLGLREWQARSGCRYYYRASGIVLEPPPLASHLANIKRSAGHLHCSPHFRDLPLILGQNWQLQHDPQVLYSHHHWRAPWFTDGLGFWEGQLQKCIYRAPTWYSRPRSSNPQTPGSFHSTNSIYLANWTSRSTSERLPSPIRVFSLSSS